MAPVLVTIAIVLIIALQIYWSISAKRTHVLTVAITPAEAAAVLTRVGNVTLWGTTSGPGTVNRRLRKFSPILPPVVSFDIADVSHGDIPSSEVSMWMSEYSGVLGVANFAALAVLLKRKAVKKLSMADDARRTQPGAAVPPQANA